MRATHCEKFQHDLSAFADDTLTPRRLEQVGYHVAGCPECQAEVAALRQVRETLSAGCHEPMAAPGSLAERLTGIAGDHCDAPLYLSSGATRTLPSKRRARSRGLVTGGVAVVTVMASALALALFLAPGPPKFNDPVALARQQYSLSTTAISVNEAVGAVLLASTRGGVGEADASYHARPMLVTQRTPLSADEAAGMLGESMGISVTLSGTQRVWIARGDAYTATDVHVDQVAGEGTNLVVLGAQGGKSSSWFVPTIETTSATSAWQFWLYGKDLVAGRWAWGIEATDASGLRVARWWVDSNNGTVLWSEYYGDSGRPSVASGYTELTMGEAELDPAQSEVLMMSPASTAGERAWCRGLGECPETLAGLPLVAFFSSEGEGASTRLVYSDGVNSITACWTEGILDDGGKDLVIDQSAGQPKVAAWQSGDGVIFLATDGSFDSLWEAAEDLPAREPYAASLQERLSDGVAWLFGTR
ncbi:MAG: anti-sigma factor family protein [Arachnia sp.]